MLSEAQERQLGDALNSGTSWTDMFALVAGWLDAARSEGEKAALLRIETPEELQPVYLDEAGAAEKGIPWGPYVYYPDAVAWRNRAVEAARTEGATNLRSRFAMECLGRPLTWSEVIAALDRALGAAVQPALPAGLDLADVETTAQWVKRGHWWINYKESNLAACSARYAAERVLAALEKRRGAGGCADCGRPYGAEHGFPDLVLTDAAWARIAPRPGGGGLLCPSCICKRLHGAGLADVTGAFMSGPIASVSAHAMEQIAKPPEPAPPRWRCSCGWTGTAIVSDAIGQPRCPDCDEPIQPEATRKEG